MGKASQFQPPDLISTGILERAAKDWGWKGQTAKNRGRKWYEAFLHVVYNNPGGRVFIVTKEADQLWHTHITYTVRYRQYCEAILGFYLDHTPTLAALKFSQEDADAAKQAYKGVIAEYDIIVPTLMSCCW